MNIRNDIRLSFLLLAGDIAAINLGVLFAYWFRFNSGFFEVVYGVPHVAEYIRMLPVVTMLLVFLIRSEGLYHIKVRLSIVDEFFLLIKVNTLGLVIFMAATFIYREFSFSRGMLLSAWFALTLFLGSWRLGMNRIQFRLRMRRQKSRNLLIIGDGKMVERLIKHISGDPHWDYNIKGVVRVSSDKTGTAEGVPVLGKIDRLGEIMDSNDINEIIMSETDISRAKTMKLIFECEKRLVEFRLVADLLGVITSKVDMRTIDGIPLLGLKETPLSEGFNRFVKRSVDVVFSVLFLVAFSPILGVIALAVKITSPGPVFYLQKRVGEDGSRFAIIKFRTMRDNAEKGVGRVWAKENDPRRTPIGGFLRRFNLDELPQLLNVLKGEMSLVGPRPERPHFVKHFKENIPRYMARHKIKSGMTGWAQVNGLRGNTSIEERTKYDLYYVENWSLGFDIKILFMSLFALKNAY
ncbi:MAG: undecaprenyl-phosphate glucose phosphotransferase [Candidatus Omnitrophica bacterium]|nr:undecaprenyl-phosphate glucose phosphotransferase [Candidatus Omnitrophota bacterium]